MFIEYCLEFRYNKRLVTSRYCLLELLGITLKPSEDDIDAILSHTLRN